MSERILYTQYKPMARQSWYNQQIVRSMEMTTLVNNTLAVYAGCRRNQQVISSMYPSNSDKDEMVIVLKPGETRTILNIPIEGMISGGVPLKAYIYSKTDNADRSISLLLGCGTSECVTSSIEGTSYAWHAVTCYPERSPISGSTDARFVHLQVANGDASDEETITIQSISIFEEPDPNCASWIDWTGASNKIGVEDQALTPAMLNILKSNLDYVAKQRLPRANVYNRCFKNNYRTTENAYEAANDGMGRYVIRTKADIDELVVLLNTDMVGGGLADTPKTKFRVGAYDMDGNSIDSFEVEMAPTGGAENFAWLGCWYRDTLDISGRTAGDDTIEIRVDSKESNGTVEHQKLWNICIVESAVASDVSYELPNRKYVQPDDDIRASDVLNVKNTITHLYNRATQIVLNDLRVEEPARHIKIGTPYIATAAYGGIHELLKYWSNKFCGRGVLAPSVGSKNLILQVIIDRPDPKDICGALKYDNPSSAVYDFESLVLTGAADSPTITSTHTIDVGGGATDTHIMATGRLLDLDATNKIITMDRCQGSWVNDDELERLDWNETADIVGTLYVPEDETVELNLMVTIEHGSPISSSFQIYNYATLKVGRTQGLISHKFRIQIPEEAWEDTALTNAYYDAVSTPLRDSTGMSYSLPGPYTFTVQAYCTSLEFNLPYVRLVRVYEETPNVL